MASLEFRVDGEKVLSRNLRIIADGITDMAPEMGKIGALVKADALENMASQSSEGGGAWKPLAPFTVAMRAKRWGYYHRAPNGAGASSPVLRWTGRLAEGFRDQPGKLQVTIDNPVPYFKHHQAKDRANPRLPRRLMLEMKSASKAKAMNIIAAGLQDRLDGGNFGRQF